MPEDLDSFSWQELGNVIVVDQEQRIREMVMHCKLVLEGRRGWQSPQPYRMTKNQYDDITADFEE